MEMSKYGYAVSGILDTRKRLVIDTDVGTDDANALLMALAHKDVDVLALTTVFGNVPLQQAVANASRIRRLVRCPKEFLDAYMHNNSTANGRFVQSVMRKPLSIAGVKYGLCDEFAVAMSIDPSIILESELQHGVSVKLCGLERGLINTEGASRDKYAEFVTKLDMKKSRSYC